MLIPHLRQGILLATHSVMRARVKNYRGGTDVRPKSGYMNKRTPGIGMTDWAIFTVSTLKNQLRMEGYLSWIRYLLQFIFSICPLKFQVYITLVVSTY